MAPRQKDGQALWHRRSPRMKSSLTFTERRPSPISASYVEAGTPWLEAEFAQARVAIGTAAKRPMIFAVTFLDRKIVDAGNAQAHQPVLVEFPILVAIAAVPVAAVVVPFIGEAHSYAVAAERPEFLDQ